MRRGRSKEYHHQDWKVWCDVDKKPLRVYIDGPCHPYYLSLETVGDVSEMMNTFTIPLRVRNRAVRMIREVNALLELERKLDKATGGPDGQG